MAESSRNQLLTSINDSLVSGKYSDLVITCSSDTYNVHKMIVCSRCEFFARAIQFSGKESEDREINLPEDEPATIKLLIQYLYEGEFDPLLSTDPGLQLVTATPIAHSKARLVRRVQSARIYSLDFPHSCVTDEFADRYCNKPDVCPHHTCESTCSYSCNDFICQECLPAPKGDASQLLIHAKMYEIGDKYDVIGLKDLAKEKFDRTCKHFWNDAKFPPAAYHAFSTTVEEDNGLREIVSKTISSHMDLLKKPEIQALMREFNGLALGVLLAKAELNNWK